jgi:uncharacterized protein
MTELTAALENDPELARRYQAAHEAYVDDRDALAAELHLDVPELTEVSAGGMPDRVKCLHALVAHSLVAGPGVNPIGDQVIAALPDIAHWDTPCVDPEGDG